MNIYISMSAIHGRGVFADEPLEAEDWQYVYGREMPYIPGDLSERYGFETDDDGMIFLPFAPWCFLNHSSDPNCEVFHEGSVVYVATLRSINRFEELTIDYGFQP